MGEFGEINLDILRGWRMARAPELRQPHALPALARLVHLDSGRVEHLHGPDLLIGRYYPPNGPVDLTLGGLQEHELYQLGAPHLQMTLNDDAQWSVRHLAPGTSTHVNEDRLETYNQHHIIEDGDALQIGCARYRFERLDIELAAWKTACRALLGSADTAALFLCRNGGPCGPTIELSAKTPMVIGRTLPSCEDLQVRTPWEHSAQKPAQPDVDLAGLYPSEAKYIGFLHAEIRAVAPSAARIGGEYLESTSRASDFRVTPLTKRQKTFINRHEIGDSAVLSHGDELALGSNFFYFYCPDRGVQLTRRPLGAPTLVDWTEGATPRLDGADPSEEPS